MHAARHYKKLVQQFASHQKQYDDFLKRYWEYYRKLLCYRKAPSPEARLLLEQEFDDLYVTRTGYGPLDECISCTQANKLKLLLVLEHPELPLYNNLGELAARQRVSTGRKLRTSNENRTPRLGYFPVFGRHGGPVGHPVLGLPRASGRVEGRDAPPLRSHHGEGPGEGPRRLLTAGSLAGPLTEARQAAAPQDNSRSALRIEQILR